MKTNNKITKSVLLSLILFSTFLVAKSQLNFDNYGPRELKKMAESSIRDHDYFSAILFYEAYLKSKPSNIDVKFELGKLYLKAREYKKASIILKEVVDKYEGKYPLARFYYAQSLKLLGNYDEASKEFNIFRTKYKNYKDSRTWTKLARTEAISCDSAKLIMNKPADVTIEYLNSTINGKHVEASPIYLNEKQLLYVSLKLDSLKFFTYEDKIPTRKFYLAQKEDKDWIGGLYWDSPANLEGVEISNGALSKDGKRFYFTQCEKNYEGKYVCAIYMMKYENNKWQQPKKLPPPINDPNYSSTQPAIGSSPRPTNEVIYFVSERPEGKGGLDIWYVVYDFEKDRFGKLRNLTKINTPGNEMTPYYDQSSRTLYFSSDGYMGLGGLDIYKVTGERNNLGKVENVGYPINTSYDELYFTLSKTGEDGFFVSNRPGGSSLIGETCCDNIYYFKWNQFTRIVVTGKVYPFYKDRFGRKKIDLSKFDFMNPSDTVKPLANASIALYVKDKETGQYGFVDRYITQKDGKYYFNLLPDKDYQFKMEGFQYFESEIHLSTENITFSDTIQMPPIWVNVLSDKPIILENVYYEFNSAELTEKDKRVLDTTLVLLMKEAPEFIIELSAHTDSIGDFEYNMKLSQQRAENVVKYLVSKGIPRERLIAKGYGPLRPIAPNFKPDGSDNPEGREKNRRTEFKIVGTIYDLQEEEEFK